MDAETKLVPGVRPRLVGCGRAWWEPGDDVVYYPFVEAW